MNCKLAIAIAALAILGSSPALAAPCKDPRTGKFVKCPEKAPAKAARCMDAKGKFAKCGSPGAMPL